MTELGALIALRIAADGPITLADYMAECLLHPRFGYYTTRDPLGAEGDFTTAPEISQMFGEMLGLCLAQAWSDQGSPAPFILAELGPGRGTLMTDILRVIARLPAMAAAARIHLVEASPALRERQRAALNCHDVTWHDRIADLPDAPLFLVANEFFDALPIRQFHRQGPGQPAWRERVVALGPDGRPAPALGPATDFPFVADRAPAVPEGKVVEICPTLPAIAAEIGRRIARRGGAALVIDYGGWDGTGDTLQAVKAHQTADPFAEPGLADLTAHVDFAALARAFRDAGAASTAMTPQGVFLERLGITGRARDLARALPGEALDSHIAAHRRLTHPEEMGRVFKVIACHPPALSAPPGLDLPERP